MVFNCDENMDFQSLHRIFKGISYSGFFSCFDEINRL